MVRSESTERWEPVIGYSGWYEVSDYGRVRRIRAGPGTFIGRIRKLNADSGGYLHLELHRDGNRRNHLVHRLVIAAFIGPCPRDKEVNHRDGIKANNYLKNLEYVTRQENSYHAAKVGLMSRGEQRYNAKLTEANVHTIRGLLGIETQKAIGRRFNVSPKTISGIARGKRWTWLKEIPKEVR